MLTLIDDIGYGKQGTGRQQWVPPNVHASTAPVSMADVSTLASLGLSADSVGVFPDRLLRKAIEQEIIEAGRYKMAVENIQPASIDLRLGQTAHRIQCSFLPGNETVASRLKELGDEHKLDLTGAGAVLESERPYLIELKERLNLPVGVRAKANPKSSTGRVDVFTRVITDYGQRFDEIADGYTGPLYLEVVPLSFPVRVNEDLTLNQLRLFVGNPDVGDDALRAFHKNDLPVLYRDGLPADLDNSATLSNGLFLGLDLRREPEVKVGFSAKRGAPDLDLTSDEPKRTALYWDPVYAKETGRIVLVPRTFYLLMSDEAVCIPPTMSAEMTAYDPTSGELRTHYAGFFDPGFGYDETREVLGSRAALEVRAHDVKFMIETGQRVCKLTFQWMLEPPERSYGRGIGSSYQGQAETLSKYFLQRRPLDPGEWPAAEEESAPTLFAADDGTGE